MGKSRQDGIDHFRLWTLALASPIVSPLPASGGLHLHFFSMPDRDNLGCLRQDDGMKTVKGRWPNSEMPVDNPISNPDSHARRLKWLRTLGVLILLLGLGGAGAVYWTGTPPDDLSADPATARSYKTESRDIEINFGKLGLLMIEWENDLKYPGTQAVIIIAVSGLAASGCFFFAHLIDRGVEPDDPVV
jgi:hypothetical protein